MILKDARSGSVRLRKWLYRFQLCHRQMQKELVLGSFASWAINYAFSVMCRLDVEVIYRRILYATQTY